MACYILNEFVYGFAVLLIYVSSFWCDDAHRSISTQALHSMMEGNRGTHLLMRSEIGSLPYQRSDIFSFRKYFLFETKHIS